jgi:hypothetical protein
VLQRILRIMMTPLHNPIIIIIFLLSPSNALQST